jgi:hypothetical protein
MFLLIHHLECTKEFLCLIHALWQNVILQKQAGNNCQQSINGFLTQIVQRLERHYTSNGIRLRNIHIVVKWFPCRIKHVIERLCGRLWLVLRTSFGKLCLMIVIQHVRYPDISILNPPRVVSPPPLSYDVLHHERSIEYSLV